MNKQLAAPHIDFADSEYVAFQMTEHQNLTIFMKNWQEESLRIVFKHVIEFIYKLGDVPKDLYELDNSSFLTEALQLKYTSTPPNHPYKHFQLEDIDDFPFIQVIAESVTVIKE
ncbi:MAG: hypothetical protein ACH350_10360 [Parachlamydiaceae bacterium]